LNDLASLLSSASNRIIANNFFKFCCCIFAGIRHEQNLYVKLIDATTKKVNLTIILY